MTLKLTESLTKGEHASEREIRRELETRQDIKVTEAYLSERTLMCSARLGIVETQHCS